MAGSGYYGSTARREIGDELQLAPRFSPWWLALPMLASAAVRDLWAPDEARYAMVAKWIYDHGEFLVLHRCGELYPDKPPLVFWLAGLLGWLTSWSVFAMRLVSVGAMLGTAWMVGRLARRWLGELEAAWAPVLFLGFALVSWHGGRLQLDPLLTVACTASILFATAPAASVRAASRTCLLAGLCAGIGALVKGPVAYVDVGLPLLLWRCMLRRDESDGRRASRSAFAGALALALLPVVAWAAAASSVEPALARPLFFGEHVGRVLEGRRHRNPPWEPLIEMPFYLLPWTVPVVLGLVAAVRGWRGSRAQRSRDGSDPRSDGLLRAAWWFVGLFVFFSVVPTKRELYLLPAYPACALLAARGLCSALRAGHVGGWLARFPLALFALIAVVLIGGAGACGLFGSRLAPWTSFAPGDVAWRAAVAGTPFGLGAVLGWRLLARRALRAWASLVAFSACAGGVVLYATLGPVIDPLKSDRATAQLLASLPQHPSEIPFYGVQADGARFYGGGPCVNGEDGGLVDGDVERRMAKEGADFLAVVSDRLWRRTTTGRERFRVVARDEWGPDRCVVIAAAAQPQPAPPRKPRVAGS